VTNQGGDINCVITMQLQLTMPIWHWSLLCTVRNIL